MARPIGIRDLTIVFGSRIGVFDQQTDRRAGGAIFKYTGKDFHPVFLAALGYMARGARFARIKIWLDDLFGQQIARRAAIDDAANGRAVAFAPGGKSKKMTECIM